MNKKESLQKDIVSAVIKEELNKRNIPLKKILLFGSRAKGTALHGSDWDFMAVIDKDIGRKDIIDLESAIRLRLARDLIDADIIIKSAKDYSEQSANVGYLAYYATKEGVLYE